MGGGIPAKPVVAGTFSEIVTRRKGKQRRPRVADSV